MSRYFKYKSPEGLLADARALGLNIELTSDLSPLLRPIEVSGRRVGNRLAIQPMEGCDGQLDGSPGELTFRRYRRFGAGGAKLIWGEAAAVVPEGRANPRQLVISSTTAAGLERMLGETAARPTPLRPERTTTCWSAFSSPTLAGTRSNDRSWRSTTPCSILARSSTRRPAARRALLIP